MPFSASKWLFCDNQACLAEVSGLQKSKDTQLIPLKSAALSPKTTNKQPFHTPGSQNFFSRGPFQSHEVCSSRADRIWWSERYFREESSLLWFLAQWDIILQGEGTLFKGAEEGGLLPACTSASYHLPRVRQNITLQPANLMHQWNTKVHTMASEIIRIHKLQFRKH